MSRRLLISWLPGETRAALERDGRLERLVVLRRDHPRRFGNVYLGRVTGRHDGLGALLVDIGAERDALLPTERLKAPASEGDRLIVEVAREAPAGKGVRVRMAEADPALEAQAGGLKAPALLRRGSDPLTELLAGAEPPDEILIDQAPVLAELKRRFGAHALARARLAPAGAALFEQEGLEAAIDDLLTPEVPLPSGGSLLIEPVRSMVPIDVNSGPSPVEGGAPGRAATTDGEAADEIPRQLRLRSLSGLVVIDFLELEGPARRKALEARLREGFAADPAKVRVARMRTSGLVELTRQRREPALFEVLTEPCGLGGAGRRKSAATLGYQALRSVLAAAARQPGKALTLNAAQEVAAVLEGPLSEARLFTEARLGRPLRVVALQSRADPGPEVVIGSEP